MPIFKIPEQGVITVLFLIDDSYMAICKMLKRRMEERGMRNRECLAKRLRERLEECLGERFGERQHDQGT